MSAHIPPFPVRKRFGQHFLRDPAVISRIIECIAPAFDDRLIEIGPGAGALTRPLLQRVNRLTVIEIDRDLARRLASSPTPAGRLRVHCEDVLRFDFARAARENGGALRIVGNLPYNLSTPLLFRLVRFHQHVGDVHFMLQREVVERLAAQPGDAAYSRLSVMSACCYETLPLFDVTPDAFAPRPKVVSGFVRLLPKPAPPPDVRERLDSLVKLAFSQRRKTVANALSSVLDRAALERIGIDPEQRPDTLRIDQFMKMMNNAADAPRGTRHAGQTL